uniref:Uncharacterized protein n=1 Tax=Oryza barthii TaxID=65489 RepID=A0A0D3GTL8_9ORYZ
MIHKSNKGIFTVSRKLLYIYKALDFCLALGLQTCRTSPALDANIAGHFVILFFYRLREMKKLDRRM